MKTNTTVPDYKGYCFPPEIINHAVWLSFRFSLSFRDGEELLAECGIAVTCETVRQWCLKFGQTSANELRCRRLRCGDIWHMDEVSLKINGKILSLGSRRSRWHRVGLSLSRADDASRRHNASFGSCA